jgi:cytochrome c-type biogenesis protein CcmE
MNQNTQRGNRRRLLVGALLLLGVSVSYLSYVGIEKNLVYYLSAQELIDKGAQAHGATVRLGGVVQQSSVQWDAKTLELKFNVGILEHGGPHVAVRAHGAPPQMFQEGIGAVVEGSYDGTVFEAERVMVKHSNEYRPPAAGEAPSDRYSTLQRTDTP